MVKAKPQGPSVDLDIHVKLTRLNGETGLAYTLHSPSGYQFTEIEGPRIKGSPQDYWRHLMERIEQLAGKRDVDETGLSGEEVVRHLEGIGRDLFHELFSPPLRQEYLNFRKSVQTLQITSEEPWIPWELIKPFDSDWDLDDEFLCIQFQLTRWLSGKRTAPLLIQAASLACVEAGMVKGRPPLPLAQREKKMLSGLAGTIPGGKLHSPRQSSLPEVISLLAKGGNQLIHFVSHGDFDAAQPNQSEIMLADGKSLRPHDLQGPMEARLKADRPLVFLNACRVGALSWSLTGLGGWAQRWLRRCGCSAFVGPQWSVTDHNAYAFAMGFYFYLKQGKTIGEAAQQARLKVREKYPHDPTWLAYSVYAHPNACLVLGEVDRAKPVAPECGIEKPEGDFEIPPPPSSPEPSWADRLLAAARKHPAWTAVGALFLTALLAAGLLWLGQQSHREREYLLQIDALEYPLGQLLLTGAEALYSLPQKAIGALVLGNAPIRLSALLLIVLAAGWLWLARRLRSTGGAWGSKPLLAVALRLALLALTALSLTLGSLFYILAIQATDPSSNRTETLADCPAPSPGGSGSRAGLVEQMRFETCSWLRNDSDRNNDRRESLNGLILWLLAALGAAAWAAWRIPASGSWARWVQKGLGAVQLLVLLFLATRLPTAHAYGQWGLRYPEVRSFSEECSEDLRSHIQKEGCRIYDISVGSLRQAFFLTGSCAGVLNLPSSNCRAQTRAKSVLVGKGALAPIQ